jgi:DNA-directed RNA polymerase specialized sigma24 family protein
MDDPEWLAKQFEAYRGHLREVSYRMLGSLSEADDAVQEAWLRLCRSDGGKPTTHPTTTLGEIAHIVDRTQTAAVLAILGGSRLT